MLEGARLLEEEQGHGKYSGPTMWLDVLGAPENRSWLQIP